MFPYFCPHTPYETVYMIPKIVSGYFSVIQGCIRCRETLLYTACSHRLVCGSTQQHLHGFRPNSTSHFMVIFQPSKMSEL